MKALVATTGSDDLKVLVLHRYFWPQSYPYAQMLKDITEEISTQHSVSVLTTSTGNFEEKNLRDKWSISKNINVEAIHLGAERKASLVKKFFNAAYFGFWVFFKLLTTNTDVVMVATTPPVIMAMFVRWMSYLRGFKYIYHCQDIHPEGMFFGGSIQKGRIYNLLLSIDKANVDAAWKVITLSKDMKQTLVGRDCKTSHVKIINNFIFENFAPCSTLLDNAGDKLTILFAGSLGRLQNLDVLMNSLVLLRHRKDLHFSFMGDGIMLDEMMTYKEENKLYNVSFLGQRTLKEAVAAMQVADFGIVSIGSSIAKVAYPSKTMMYLGNGLPILAIVDEGTEVFDFINKNRIGKAIAPISAQHIADGIETFIDEIKTSPINKYYVKGIAEREFGKEVILPKFLDLFL